MFIDNFKTLLTLFISTIIALTSCNSTQERDVGGESKRTREDSLTLVEDNSKLILPIDSRTPYTTTSMSYYIERKSGSVTKYLTYLNSNIPSIQFYDIENRKLSFSVKFQVEGPEGVGRPSGYKVINPDSIYIVSGYDYKITLIDNSGNVLKSCSLLQPNQGKSEITGMPQVYTPMPIFFVGNRIYMNIAPDRNVFSDYYFEGHTNLSLDFSNCDFFYFNTYPNSLKGKVWGSVGVGFSTSKNDRDQFIYSFAPDENLYLYDPVLDTSYRYYAGSKYIDKIEPMKNGELGADRKYVFETANYGSIIFDKYRDVYYRIVKHAIPEVNETSGVHNSFFDKQFSIIILDNNFKIVGETLFPGKKHHFNNYFLTEEGLYISNSNDKNPELKENELSYTLLKLQTL